MKKIILILIMMMLGLLIACGKQPGELRNVSNIATSEIFNQKETKYYVYFHRLDCPDCDESAPYVINYSQIIKEYEGRLPFYHMDVYRIDSEDDMYDLGYDEYIYSEGVTVIEWSKLIEGILPEERIKIEIKRINDTKREINIDGKGFIFEKLVSELNNENTFN